MGKSAKSVKKAKMELKEKRNAMQKNKPISRGQGNGGTTKPISTPKKKISNTIVLHEGGKNEKIATPKAKKSSSKNYTPKKVKERRSPSVDFKEQERKVKSANAKIVEQNIEKEKERDLHLSFSKNETQQDTSPLVIPKEVNGNIAPKKVERKIASKTTLEAEPVKKNGQVVGQIKKKGSTIKNVGMTHTTQIPSGKSNSSFELPKKKSTISAEDSMLKLANELKVENQKKKQKKVSSKKKDFTLEDKKRKEEKDLLKDIVISLEEESRIIDEVKEEVVEQTLSKREEKYAYQAELAAREAQEDVDIIPSEEDKNVLVEEDKLLPIEDSFKDISLDLENMDSFKNIDSPYIEEERKEDIISSTDSILEKQEEVKVEPVKIKKKIKEKKRLTKTGMVFKVLAWIAFIFFVFSTIHLFIRVMRINLLPMKYIYISIGVLSFLSLFFLLFAKSRKKVLHFLQILICVILGGFFTFGAIFIMKSDASLKNLFSAEEDMTTYYVVTLKDNKYSTLSSLEDNVIGLMKQNSSKVKEALGDYNYLYKEYDVVGELTNSLVSDSKEKSYALVIDSNVYDALPELDSDLYEQIRVIHEFELHVQKEEVSLEVEETTIEENPENKEVYQGPKRNPNLLDGLNIGNSYIVYLSGIDGGGYARPYGLSDVNILIVVNPDTHRILLVSTPRDYFVQVAGTTGLKDKLTHAGLYGINASIGTMQNLYGVKINNYAKVTFGAIQTLVDDIGGIEVYSDTAFYSFHKKGWYVEKGMNYMDGAKALAYSRERYAYAGGDRHRIKNQQDVISAIIKKVATDPQQLLKFNTILSDIDPYFTTDISYDRMQQMVKEQLNTLKPWSVSSVSVNGTNGSSVTASWPNQVTYVMYPSENTIVDAQTKIVEVMTGA